jgi:hypothetical protein
VIPVTAFSGPREFNIRKRMSRSVSSTWRLGRWDQGSEGGMVVRCVGSNRVFCRGVLMPTNKDRLQVLKRELEFLGNGGYRAPLVWRSPLIFEDSPTCPKARWSACPHSDCTLLAFVPQESRDESVPCRHIPLNERGETLESLYTTGTNEEVEDAVRSWLLRTIQQLEEACGMLRPRQSAA